MWLLRLKACCTISFSYSQSFVELAQFSVTVLRVQQSRTPNALVRAPMSFSISQRAVVGSEQEFSLLVCCFNKDLSKTYFKHCLVSWVQHRAKCNGLYLHKSLKSVKTNSKIGKYQFKCHYNKHHTQFKLIQIIWKCKDSKGNRLFCCPWANTLGCLSIALTNILVHSDTLTLNCIRYPALPLVHKGGSMELPLRKPLSHRNCLIIFTPYIYTLITTIFQEKNIKYLYRFKMAAK